jgi:hypothetical protein
MGARNMRTSSKWKKRHGFQAVHSFRKFFKSHGEQVMKSINVEIRMGHTIGISNSYYKPSEREILDDNLKAINVLTINKNNNSTILEKRLKNEKKRMKKMNILLKQNFKKEMTQ